jgi:hypothetical protein
MRERRRARDRRPPRREGQARAVNVGVRLRGGDDGVDGRQRDLEIVAQ